MVVFVAHFFCFVERSWLLLLLGRPSLSADEDFMAAQYRHKRGLVGEHMVDAPTRWIYS